MEEKPSKGQDGGVAVAPKGKGQWGLFAVHHDRADCFMTYLALFNFTW